MIAPVGSLGGLQAASQRLNVASNNIANQLSTGTVNTNTNSNAPVESNARPVEQVTSPNLQAYQPQQLLQTTGASGEVLTSLQSVEPATRDVFQPDNPAANEEGIVQYPNVELTTEIANVKLAANEFRANLRALEAQDDVLREVISIGDRGRQVDLLA